MPLSSSVVCRPLEDDLQTKEDDQNFNLQTNKASLNLFECSEIMGTIKGR